MPGNHHDPLAELFAAGPATVDRPNLGTGYRGYDAPRPKGGTVDLRILMQWRHSGTITVDGLGRLAFPVLPDRPGLYRFTWVDSICGHRTFVGEAGNLWRRLIAYRHPGPGQVSDQYVSDLLLTHLGAGGTADVAIAMYGELYIGGADQKQSGGAHQHHSGGADQHHSGGAHQHHSGGADGQHGGADGQPTGADHRQSGGADEQQRDGADRQLSGGADQRQSGRADQSTGAGQRRGGGAGRQPAGGVDQRPSVGIARDLDLGSAALRELAVSAALMQCVVAGDTDIVN